jgi:lysozyme
MNPTMTYSKSGAALTERFEGCRLVAYLDSVGVLTIGYGHTFGVTEGMVCTQEQATAWLLEDTEVAQADVNKYVTAPITQLIFDSLVDFAFNVGRGNLNNSTLLKDLNARNYLIAADEFVKWDHAGGVEVAGLLRRRQAEADEFRQGIPCCPTL